MSCFSAWAQAGNESSWPSQPAWPGMVVPVVNKRKPEKPRPCQWSIFSTASGAIASIE